MLDYKKEQRIPDANWGLSAPLHFQVVIKFLMANSLKHFCLCAWLTHLVQVIILYNHKPHYISLF